MLSFMFRAYPTKAQEAALETHLTEACRLYNACLHERRDAWNMSRMRITYASQSGQLKDIRAAGDIGIPNFNAARSVLRRVDAAFDGFFRRVKAGEKPGFPRFRSHRRYDSIVFTVGNGAHVAGSVLKLHGIGSLKLRVHRAIAGQAKQATIKRDAGRWFVIFAVESAAQPLPPSTTAVGVDVGLTSFATFSDGTEVENPRHERTAARSVRIARRAVSRRRRGSRRRQKAVQRLQRAIGKVRRQRADFHHKVARAIVNAHGFIAVEDLNVKGLAAGRLARSVNDAGWASFIDKLAYKAESAGRVLVKVNPAGTSQTCPCGQAVPKTLSERWHDCPACGLSVGRDHAAALNILRLGLSRQALTAASAAVA